MRELKATQIFRNDPCNAAEVTGKLAGIVLPGGNGSRCQALEAALQAVPAEQRERLEKEFVAISGSAGCAMLRGRRCPWLCELAAGLIEKYRRRADPSGKPKVLLLGDSIRGNYQEIVSRELSGEFEVVYPNENCRFAKYLLNQLNSGCGYFAECGEPDLIHWNAGLWDSAIVCREDGMFTPPEEYLRYVKLIQRELEKHCSKVIFATTTPVLPGSLNQQLEFIDQLNAAVLPWMQSCQVPVNDLYGIVQSDPENLLGEDCIHLSPAGAARCGKAVADAIRREWSRYTVFGMRIKP